MVIQYGPFSNGLQVGLQFSYTPSSPTTDTSEVDMTVEVFVNGADSGQGWNDRQRVVVKVTSPDYIKAREEFSYQYTGTAPIKVGELQFKRSLFYDQNAGVTVWAKVYDAHRGAQPKVEYHFRLPKRPEGVPGRPFMWEVTEQSFGNQNSPLDPNDINGDSNALLRWTRGSRNSPEPYVRYNLQIWHEEFPFSDPNGAVFEPGGDATFNRDWQDYGAEYGFNDPVKHRTYQIDHAVFYKARASMTNEHGTSPWSNVVHFQGPIITPRAPDVMATPGITTISATADITDDGGAEVTAYRWRIGTDPDTVPTVPESAPETETNTFLFEGLTRDTAYTVWARGVNSQGFGEWGKVATVTLPTVPSSPEGLTVEDTGANEVTITWQAPLDNGGDPISGYRVEWSTDPSFGSLTGFANIGVSLSYIASVTLPGKYFFRVRAVNINGDGLWSPSLSNIPSVPIRYWNGEEWLARRLLVWTASGWIEPLALRYWDGANWVEVS